MDDLDLAEKNAEFIQAIEIANVRAQPRIAPRCFSCCLNCGEPLDRVFPTAESFAKARRFCDADCAREWEKRNPGK